MSLRDLNGAPAPLLSELPYARGRDLASEYFRVEAGRLLTSGRRSTPA